MFQMDDNRGAAESLDDLPERPPNCLLYSHGQSQTPLQLFTHAEMFLSVTVYTSHYYSSVASPQNPDGAEGL